MARPAALYAQGQQVAQAVAALASAPAISICAAPLVVLSPDRDPRQVIGLHAGGRTIRLDADETILVAVTLEQERPFAGAEALAAGLRNAVAVTDLLAWAARMKILRSPTGQG